MIQKINIPILVRNYIIKVNLKEFLLDILIIDGPISS